MITQTQNDAIEQIKDRIDIVEIVSEHVALKKNGRNFWGCCPFHKEKTPSFSVNPEKGIFKCFGCGAGGDAITFLMKLQNSSFMDIIADLAQRYGIELPKFGFSNDKSELKKKIIEANNATAQFYMQSLKELGDAKFAREYLDGRGFNEAVIKEFQLGYSPKKYDELFKFLKGKGFEEDLLVEAGLVYEKNDKKGCTDRFRNRLMIPISDEKGDVVAFGARLLDDDNGPKYLNSSETPVFNKSKTLYGLYQAKQSIKEQDSVLIMEGYFDVITAHVNGIKNAVASCGTSMTEQHIKMLTKYTLSRKIYLAFDADEAGKKAAERGAAIIKETFSSLGNIRQFDESYAKTSFKNDFACEIRVISTPSGKDPDEFIKTEGVESYKKCIKDAPLLIDYQINSIMNIDMLSLNPQEKLTMAKQIIPILAEINNVIILDEYTKTVAQKLQMDINTLKQEVLRYQSGKTRTIEEKSQNVTISLKRHVFAQKNLLSLYFINNEKIPFSWLNEKLMEVNFTEANLIIIKETIGQISQNSSSIKDLTNKLMTTFAENTEIKEDLADIIYSIDDKISLVEDSDLLSQYINESINCINSYVNDKEFERLKLEYRNSKGDEAAEIKMQQKIREELKRRLEL